METSQLRQRAGNGARSIRARKPTNERKKCARLSAELQAAAASTKHRNRIWTRTVVIFALLTVTVVFYTKNKTRETKFALVREQLPLRMQRFKCAENYEAEMRQYPECVPKKCGRFVSDKLVDAQEAKLLLELARSIIPQAGSTGGASILDLHTGALSYKEEFVNVFNIEKLAQLIQPAHLTVYNLVKGKIKMAIAEQFGITPNSLYLTYPTFFSRITNTTAKTVHDEYWHEHVDKETYPSFHYTSLLYLTTFGTDFNGGRFIFVDGVPEVNRTTSIIEPKLGRVSAFTSGEENRHHVEQLQNGERYAITISFTCDVKLGINDPEIKSM